MSTPPPPAPPLDAFSPAQIALLVESAGVRKAALPVLQTLMLGVLAGSFIAFGAMLFTVVITGSELGYGPTRLLGGLAFSMGLILVVVGGAELFTGNNLIVMAWADRRIGTLALLRNWTLVYVANFAGAAANVVLMHVTGLLAPGSGSSAATAAAIAAAKVELSFVEAFTRGVLCNVLVCLALWLSYAARRVSGKILAIALPVAAFIALGFEHSVANMYLIPMGMLAAGQDVDAVALVANLVPVTLGNVVGGAVLVALVYWVIYLRGKGEAVR
jgi:formate/nitrite transporter